MKKIYNDIKCELCGENFIRITNTHLKNSHGITCEEYQNKFPNSLIEDPQLSLARLDSRRGKTYNKLFSKEENLKQREIRRISATEQWLNNEENVTIKNNKNIKIFLKKIIPETIGRPRETSVKMCICKECGMEFDLSKSDRGGLFCSSKCFVTFSKKTATNYRIKAFALLENCCVRCNENNKKKLIVHHKDRNFFNDDLNNLEILCTHCHNKEHIIDNTRGKLFKDGQIIRGWRLILDGLRLDVKDPNFKHTPERILRSYYEIFNGIECKKEIDEILSTSFPTNYKGIVIESPIRCYSMCPHHFLPVVYDVSIGYIPNEGGLGLSKLPRLVELLAKAPKLQEDYTKEIVDIIDKTIHPVGVIVIVKGDHLCMQMRGTKKTECSTTTSDVRGVFAKSEPGKYPKEEFMRLIGK